MTRDYEHIIRTCELDNWKEALAVVLTYAKGEDFANLCSEFHIDVEMISFHVSAVLSAVLGDRLDTAGAEYVNSACLCYVCAGSIDRLVECWAKVTPNPNAPDALSVSPFFIGVF